VKKVDIAFVVDGSSSVGKANFRKVKTFLRKIAKGFYVSKTSSRVAVITYASSVRYDFSFERYTDGKTLDAALSRLSYPEGGTRTGLALDAAKRLFSRSRRKRTLVVITDGQPGDYVTGPSKALKKANVEVFAIGIGRDISVEDLKKIATDDRHIYRASFKTLSSIVKSLTKKVCEGKVDCIYG